MDLRRAGGATVARNGAAGKNRSFGPAFTEGVLYPRAAAARVARDQRHSSIRFESLLDHHFEGLLAHHAPERLFDTFDRPFAGKQEIGPETRVGE